MGVSDLVPPGLGITTDANFRYGHFDAILMQNDPLFPERAILCMSYIFGRLGFARLRPVKTTASETLLKLFRLLNNLIPRPVIKIPESCTTGGTPRMTDRRQNQHMLVLWRNDARQQIVMNSLQSSPKEHDKFQSMVCGAIENAPESLHGEVSAAPSNEPAMRRRDHFVRNCGQRVDVAALCNHEETPAPMGASVSTPGLPEKTVSYEWFQV
jgi:hypothetical protein